MTVYLKRLKKNKKDSIFQKNKLGPGKITNAFKKNKSVGVLQPSPAFNGDGLDGQKFHADSSDRSGVLYRPTSFGQTLGRNG